MKNTRFNRIAISAIALAAALNVMAASYSFPGLNLNIPDGDSSGLANTQIINPGAVGVLTDVNISLNISGLAPGGFNGDLYAWLRHGSGFGILLNRPGSTAADMSGYGDSGFTIILNDAASQDIHTYRNSASGPFPLDPVSGSYQPDGRFIDPDFVVDTDPRTAMLQSLNGLDPNGEWTLFVADLTSGGEFRLDGWGLELTFQTKVPDLGGTAIPFVFGILILRRTRRWVRSQQEQ